MSQFNVPLCRIGNNPGGCSNSYTGYYTLQAHKVQRYIHLLALCHFKRTTKEKGSNAKTPTEGQNCFTTKDTKHTKRSKDEALDPKLGDITQPIIAFDNPSSSILRVLRALRGEFPSTSRLASQVARTNNKPIRPWRIFAFLLTASYGVSSEGFS